MDSIIWACIKKSYVTALRSLSIPMAVYGMIFFHPRACPLKPLFSHILLTSSPQRVGMTIPSNYVLYALQVYLSSCKAGKNIQDIISNAIRITGASLRVYSQR